MGKKKSEGVPAPAAESVETLQREKELLSQQVKRLIRAEGKLYQYQEELDAQLTEYKGLYELNRRLNGTFSIEKILEETVGYVVQHLEYERAVCFSKEDETGSYRVRALDGYYEASEKKRVAGLVVEGSAPCLASFARGTEYVICQADCEDEKLVACRDKLLMNEYFLYPLGHHLIPHALLAVGNSARNVEFFRRVNDAPRTMLSMGNLVGLVSSLIESRILLEKMEKSREQERAAEARYHSIFQNAAEGIFQRTQQGRYLEANPSLARMLGYDSAAQLMAEITDIGQQLWVEPQRYSELMRLLRSRGAVEGYEARMYRRDRRVIWVSLSVRSARDPSGELYYEGTMEEITERKRAVEALRESEQKYRQLSEVLEQRVEETVDELRQKDKILIMQGRQAVMGEMISNIAHQWRQPLNMLALLVQELQIVKKKEGLTDEFVDASVKRSLEIIGQMSKTIDYFRYFFKPETEKVEFRVSETIEKTLAILEGSLRLHGIHTEWTKAEDPLVKGYPAEFIQVLLNILINARDALTTRGVERPQIRVTLSAEAGRTVVSIADNAGGIPEEIIDKIFQPYFTTKGPEQGTGIGLFMCKTIIEKNMHGTLTVRNLEGGAEFRIVV